MDAMTRFVPTRTRAFAGVALFAAPAYAQGQAPAAGGPPVLAKQLAPARGGSSRLLVTSSAFVSGAALDDKYTQNGDNMSPGMAWSKGPLGTQSYAVLAEDSGVNRAEPIVHWVIFNIPSTATSLPQNVPTDATLENGSMQGKNVRGSAGYIGPKPPAGQTHPYQLQLFPLNAPLTPSPATADP